MNRNGFPKKKREKNRNGPLACAQTQYRWA